MVMASVSGSLQGVYVRTREPEASVTWVSWLRWL